MGVVSHRKIMNPQVCHHHLILISTSLIVVTLNGVEKFHVKTYLLFRPDLRPHFWLSRGGPFFSVLLSESVSVTAVTSSQAPMSVVLTFDSTGRLTSNSGKVARQVRAPLHISLPYPRADSGAARDHGHHHGLIHAAARQAESY